MRIFLKHLDHTESYLCRALLAIFVVLLFVQIVSRQIFGMSITWIEELSVYLFIWFAYLGASYAARMSAHNRVAFHLSRLSREKARLIEAFGDLFWIGFNAVFVWVSYDFVFYKMNKFIKAQTLGIPMKWIYVILPLAFALMTIRIIQVNYMKLVIGIDPRDPDKVDVEAMADLPAEGRA